MSKVTEKIEEINHELNRISKLDGVVADKLDELETSIKLMVEDILINHPEASNSNYWGNNKADLTNILNEIEKEPEMEEILVCGKEVIKKQYLDVETNMITTLRIVKYKNSFYFTEFDDKGYMSFKKIR